MEQRKTNRGRTLYPPHFKEGLSAGIPLAYFYGHVSLDENPDLYKIQVSRLAESLEKRKADNPEGNTIISLHL